MSLLIIAIIVIVFLIVYYGGKFALLICPRRDKDSGFEYIYVEDDGNERELDIDEQEYLNTKFEFGDGARPYINPYYEERTPDGRISEYSSS